MAASARLVRSVCRLSKRKAGLYNEKRCISLIHKNVTAEHSIDLDHAICQVRDHDPSGYLPGLLLPKRVMKTTYFATRSFWVETGLRFGSTAKVPPNATPSQHLEWWQEGMNKVFEENELKGDWNHPTLRLLHRLAREEKLPWNKQHFDDILQGRRRDLDVKQYATLNDLVKHAEVSCSSLAQLVLESGNILQESHPYSHQAARLVGVCHGLTNALRTSIPVISITGKLVIPADLTAKHGVKSPRYVLSALAMGDQVALQTLQNAVHEIVDVARAHLQQARDLRQKVLAEDPSGVSVLLPGLASETFLNRLERRAQYNLTDRNLRNVGTIENAVCGLRMIAAYYRSTY